MKWNTSGLSGAGKVHLVDGSGLLALIILFLGGRVSDSFVVDSMI